jgi:hypothetical protein
MGPASAGRDAGTGVPGQRDSSEPLWRALAVFRFASLGYAMLRLGVIDRGVYSRPGWAWAVIGMMTVWTIGTTLAYARPDRRTRLLLGIDLAVTAALLLSTAALQYPSALRHGVTPVTATWLAGPVLAWAIRYGRRAGLITGALARGLHPDRRPAGAGRGGAAGRPVRGRGQPPFARRHGRADRGAARPATAGRRRRPPASVRP